MANAAKDFNTNALVTNGVAGQQLPRREFLTLMGAGAVALLATDAHGKKQAPVKKPNIIVIVADDLGYADIGVHACKRSHRDIPTPHIDSLAEHGVRFTDGYVSCPVCSPTRAGLMTGRYQPRFGYWFNPGPPTLVKETFGLPLEETTLPEVLKQAGYKTGMVGKWHLGLKDEFHPMRRGFDEFFGFLHGSHSYMDPKADKLNPILRGTEPVEDEEYLTDSFSREAVDFIKRQKDDPFFLYLSYNAVHSPMQAPEKYLERFTSIEDRKRRTYAAMLSAMDDGIGAVLDALRKAGIEQDTLVFFFSDNGGPPTANASNNAPLSGGKGSIQEGGIRVPFLMQWPAVIPQGITYRHPAISLDVFPTCVAAAQGRLPRDLGLDGVDLVPYVTGKKRGAPHERLYWTWHEGATIRSDEWKLVKPKDGPVRLYDLSKDLGETTDVSEDQLKLVKKLTKALEEWEANLKPPLWGRAQRPRRPRRRPRP